MLWPARELIGYSSTVSSVHGPGYCLVGNATEFLDPVFSSGVLLGLHGARQLAAALDGGDLDAWQAEYREGAAVFRKVIDHWYAGDFMELALAPPPLQKPYYRTGIVSLLAGDVYNPTRRTPREMADRMGELAGLVREYNARPTAS